MNAGMREGEGVSELLRRWRAARRLAVVEMVSELVEAWDTDPLPETLLEKIRAVDPGELKAGLRDVELDTMEAKDTAIRRLAAIWRLESLARSR